MRIDGTRYNFSKDYKNNTDNAGAEDLTTALGAIPGSISAYRSGDPWWRCPRCNHRSDFKWFRRGLYQYIVEQYNIDNGIWFDIGARARKCVWLQNLLYASPISVAS